eukprot:209087_1
MAESATTKDVLDNNMRLLLENKEKQIMMVSAEIDVIKSYLKPTTVMFEYGSGGSTIYFSYLVKKLFSAEHSVEWFNQMKSKIIKHENIDNVTLLYAQPDIESWKSIGCTDIGIFAKQEIFGSDQLRHTFGPNLDNKWVYASYKQRVAVFNDYINLIDKTGVKRFDVVLIDGRARGECAFKVLDYIDRDSVVIIHDWYLEEEGYKVFNRNLSTEYFKQKSRYLLPSYKRVLQYYDIIADVSPIKHSSRCSRCGLVVLRKKKK